MYEMVPGINLGIPGGGAGSGEAFDSLTLLWSPAPHPTLHHTPPGL